MNDITLLQLLYKRRDPRKFVIAAAVAPLPLDTDRYGFAGEFQQLDKQVRHRRVFAVLKGQVRSNCKEMTVLRTFGVFLAVSIEPDGYDREAVRGVCNLERPTSVVQDSPS